MFYKRGRNERMSMPNFGLSKNEREIMETLWAEGRPLTRRDIINLCEDKSRKESSIHILLNQLLEKNAIEVTGFVKIVKNYGRTFIPTLAKEDFEIMELKNNYQELDPDPSVLPEYINYLIQENDMSAEIIEELQAVLETARK